MSTISLRIRCTLAVAILAAGGCATAPVKSVVAVPSAEPKRHHVVLIGDAPDGHQAGTHEYARGTRLLSYALRSASNLPGITVEMYPDRWPDDPAVFDDAATIVLYTTGADKGRHPLLQSNRLAQLRRALERGVGLVCLHYTLYVPNRLGGPELLEWIGGYNDYEAGYSTHRVTEINPPPAEPASPAHPVSRGWTAFSTRNEFYIRQRFRDPDPRLTPILVTQLPVEKPERQVIAWAVERADGGRGFGFTGGHFHSNWFVEPFRRMVLNAIIWTAKMEVPAGGVDSPLPAEEFGLP